MIARGASTFAQTRVSLTQSTDPGILTPGGMAQAGVDAPALRTPSRRCAPPADG
jgi:hypothetical protein